MNARGSASAAAHTMHTTLPRYDIVLLGLGHTNAHVLRMWRMSPIPDARLTCVSNFPAVTYSGMLPGVLAGQYPPERMQIDLVRLCAAAGANIAYYAVKMALGEEIPRVQVKNHVRMLRYYREFFRSPQ